jgi:HEPN domain-containing protein
MPLPDLVGVLLQKADQDIYVLDKIVGDEDAPVEVFGFHAQQATEKLIKALLARGAVSYTRTHRLGELVDLATDNGIKLPEGIEFLVDLTPYAVEFRYDVAPDEGYDELDKDDVLAKVLDLRSWVVNATGGSSF